MYGVWTVLSNPILLVRVIATSGLAISTMDTMWAEAFSGRVRAVRHEHSGICGKCGSYTPMREMRRDCRRSSRVWGCDDGGLYHTRCVSGSKSKRAMISISTSTAQRQFDLGPNLLTCWGLTFDGFTQRAFITLVIIHGPFFSSSI